MYWNVHINMQSKGTLTFNKSRITVERNLQQKLNGQQRQREEQLTVICATKYQRQETTTPINLDVMLND